MIRARLASVLTLTVLCGSAARALETISLTPTVLIQNPGVCDWDSAALLLDTGGASPTPYILVAGEGKIVLYDAQASIVYETTVPISIVTALVANVGDWNSDGFDDFSLGNVFLASIHDGASGSEILTLTPHELAFSFGWWPVRNAGDVDGDGIEDFLVPGDVSAITPVVSVNSGATGESLYVVEGDAGVEYGRALAAPGDVNGDGLSDFAVGDLSSVAGGLMHRGLVRAYSGLDGAVLWERFGPDTLGGSAFGISLATVPDQDGDGLDDLLAGASTDDLFAGSVFVLSSATGSTLEVLSNPDPYVASGFGAAVIGARNLLGLDRDYALGLAWNGAGDPSRTLVHSFETGSYEMDVLHLAPFGVDSHAFLGTADFDGNGTDDFVVFHNRPSYDEDYIAVASFTDSSLLPSFLRGDVNASGIVDIADAIEILGHLFLGQDLACQSAAETNADSSLDLGDAVFLLAYLFQGGTPPIPPVLCQDYPSPFPCDSSPCP